MSDVSGNTLTTDSAEVCAADHEGTGVNVSIETVDDTKESETENNINVSNDENESTKEETEDFETVEGESVSGYEEYLFETVDRSNDNISVVTDYSNYFLFLIAVVLGLGAVICWAKGFTE